MDKFLNILYKGSVKGLIFTLKERMFCDGIIKYERVTTMRAIEILEVIQKRNPAEKHRLRLPPQT
ncbi:hypothetical protein ACQKIC_11390 [Peribacillus sp. NPDC046944]|uniref:hypothetical protein n=1 Tax=unclassified Peribacillus TaxID=2675266 RepID=UPI003CFE73DC